MKKILITGGSRGIGAAVVRRFSESGDKVAFIYHSADKNAMDLSKECNAISIKADLSNVSETVKAVENALDQLDGIDILVNNAGISLIGLFTDLTNEEWFNILNTNLSSAVLIAREVSKEMIKKHTGRIINVGSVWGRVGASCEVAYSSTKAALRGFTKALAKELGPSGITVNCVEPGVIDTDMNSCLTNEERSALIDDTPLNMIGKPEDVANLIYFLTGNEASFITGQCIGIDGGFGL